jgi:hypothetical protein
MQQIHKVWYVCNAPNMPMGFETLYAFTCQTNSMLDLKEDNVLMKQF